MSTNHRITLLLDEAESIARQPEMSRRDVARSNVLLARIASLRDESGFRRSSPRLRFTPQMRAFRDYMTSGTVEKETRDMLEGSQGLQTWTAGSQGGYLVPQEFYEELLNAMAQYDPLLGEDDVRLVRSKSVAMHPQQLAGWDLSQAESSQVGEGVQENTLTPQPTVAGKVMNAWMHRASLKASFEFEEDAFMDAMQLTIQAYGIAFARGMGIQLATGTGSGQPQGIQTGAVNSGVTTEAAGALSLDDFDAIYFSLNRAYRASPKCRWVMNDSTYALARKALTAGGYPLFGPGEDTEMIFGKKVLISPTMPSTAGSKGIIFGDLGHFVVRLGPLLVQRSLFRADYGQATYHGRMRVDSTVFDPSAGAAPPVVYATLHS